MSGKGWDRKTRLLAWGAYIKGRAENSQGEETKWRSRHGKAYSISPRILVIKIHIKRSSPGSASQVSPTTTLCLIYVSATLAFFLVFHTPTSFPGLIVRSCPHMLGFSSLFHSNLKYHPAQRPSLTTLTKVPFPSHISYDSTALTTVYNPS